MEDIAKIKDIVLEIASMLDDHRAENTLVLNVSSMCSWTDFFVIATVRSQAHLKGLLDRLNAYLKHNKVNSLNNRKSRNNQSWVLIDCGDFIIHLMEKDMRDFYELEKLWFKSESIYHSSNSS